MNFRLNKCEFVGLTLYSSAFPLSIALETQFNIPHISLLSLINLPFLVISGPILMAVGHLQVNHIFYLLLAWSIIFPQAYFAFIFFRLRSEKTGTSTTKAVLLSLGRIGAISIVTVIIGVLVLTYLFKTSV